MQKEVVLEHNYHIKSFCSIKKNTVSLNNSVVYQEDTADFLEFIKAAYKATDTKYSKFFKMDALSKLAFLAADILLKNENLEVTEGNNIAIVLSNKASSLDTDRKYQESIQNKDNYYPSPAVFVYTLPNICIGEISIKHKLYSENSFFIFEGFNAKHLLDYTNSILSTNKAEQVLCGWVEFDQEHYEAFLYLVAREGTIKHTTKEINKHYQKKI